MAFQKVTYLLFTMQVTNRFLSVPTKTLLLEVSGAEKRQG